jgi:hypothetical protein
MDATSIIAVRAPQWAGDPRLPTLIAYATEKTGSRLFACGGNVAQEAIALRVLHWLALENQMGGNPGIGTTSGVNSAGVITGEHEGDLSRSYANVMEKCYSAALSMTPYGVELQALVQGNVFAPMTRAPLIGIRTGFSGRR